MTQRYKATIAYDGAAYAGWQVQPGQCTVQGECERVLHEITRESIRVHSSGRTDSGVHARAQVAHFDLSSKVTPGKFKLSLNALLDDDIRVTSLAPVSSSFHARFSAVKKEYRYFIWNNRIVPPHLRRYRLQFSRGLDIDKMRRAAARLVGHHDFESFCSHRGKADENTVRNLLELNVRKKGNEFTIIAVSEGFLYKMVRSLAGFLLRVGSGRIPVEETDDILNARVRNELIPSAKPHGLFLWKVSYR
jgi:tRNA pseudouridine38-40 synthase